MRLLDLFCGAGGAAVGYHRAGFTEIIGVDNGSGSIPNSMFARPRIVSSFDRMPLTCGRRIGRQLLTSLAEL